MKLTTFNGSPFFRAMVLALVVGLAPCGVNSTLLAQVVQLPSVQTFGATGAVSVPDSGTGYLGGNSRMRSGTNVTSGGVGRNRSSASQVGAGSMSMTAVVVDLQAMDEAILNQPVGKSTVPSGYAARTYGTPVMNTLTPKFYSRQTGIGFGKAPLDPNSWQMALGASGAAEIGHAGALVHDDTDVRYYMQRAAEASNAGRLSAARVYYQLATEHLTPDQRARMQLLQTRNEAASTAIKQSTAAAVSGVRETPVDSAAGAAAGAAVPTADAPSSAPADSGTAPATNEASPFDMPSAPSDASPF